MGGVLMMCAIYRGRRHQEYHLEWGDSEGVMLRTVLYPTH